MVWVFQYSSTRSTSSSIVDSYNLQYNTSILVLVENRYSATTKETSSCSISTSSNTVDSNVARGMRMKKETQGGAQQRPWVGEYEISYPV